MFTGIVEEIGRIVGWQESSEVCRLTIGCAAVTADARQGDSIAVNGVCLTAASVWQDGFTADILVESLRSTALRLLRVGSPVNLERALAVGGRLGGHFVTGHVDGVGRIQMVTRERNSLWYRLEIPEPLIAYLVPKGSIAVDGTSLTIASLHAGGCTVSLIPHTADATVLGRKGPGDSVNIETDLLGKYVFRKLQAPGKPAEPAEPAGQASKSALTEEHLRNLGF